MYELLQTIGALLGRGTALWLACIAAKRGVAPRGPGAAMIIAEGRVAGGSIGGGELEHLVASLAAETPPGRALLLGFTVSHGHAAPAAVGQGTLDIALAPLGPEQAAVWSAAAALARERRSGHLLIGLDGQGAALLAPGRAPVGELQPPEGALPGQPGLVDLPGGPALCLPLAPPPAAFILGAGHVAQALAPILGGLGLHVVLCDDLPGSAETPAAKVGEFRLRPYDRPFGPEGPGPDDCVVCMARTHELDRQSLGVALERPLAYLGMIGSSRKKQELFEALARAGHPGHSLQRVHCPIGLDIGARTPAEIAVSIAAEIIAVRARASRRAATKEETS